MRRRSIVVLGRASRQASGIKVRQPLSELSIAGVPQRERERVEALSDLILSELNVKGMEWSDAAELATLRAVPVFPALPGWGSGVNGVFDSAGPSRVSRWRPHPTRMCSCQRFNIRGATNIT